VRQTDIEGEKALLAGQLIWFRRGALIPRQTPKGIDVTLVDIDMAKILRAAEREGITWSTFLKAVLEDDAQVLASFKSLQSSASNKSKLANFKADAMRSKPKAGATKGTQNKTKGSLASEASANMTEMQAGAPSDVDLRAFLGSGSIEEMRANLKYAPQWVTDKFNLQHGLAA